MNKQNHFDILQNFDTIKNLNYWVLPTPKKLFLLLLVGITLFGSIVSETIQTSDAQLTQPYPTVNRNMTLDRLPGLYETAEITLRTKDLGDLVKPNDLYLSRFILPEGLGLVSGDLGQQHLILSSHDIIEHKITFRVLQTGNFTIRGLMSFGYGPDLYLSVSEDDSYLNDNDFPLPKYRPSQIFPLTHSSHYNNTIIAYGNLSFIEIGISQKHIAEGLTVCLMDRDSTGPYDPLYLVATRMEACTTMDSSGNWFFGPITNIDHDHKYYGRLDLVLVVTTSNTSSTVTYGDNSIYTYIVNLNNSVSDEPQCISSKSVYMCLLHVFVT